MSKGAAGRSGPPTREQAKVRWTYKYPKDSEGGIFSPVYGAGGRLYFLEGDTSGGKYNASLPYTGGMPPKDFQQLVWLTALDAKRGTVIWRTELHRKVTVDLDAREPNPVVLRSFSMANDSFIFPLIPKAYAVCR